MDIENNKQLKNINSLKEYGTVPVGASLIKENLKEYDFPNNKISSLAKDGYIVRLKKGLYVTSSKLTEKPYNKFVIANNIYGPSYISIHSALSFYGLIPENVHTVTSVTFKQSKSYDTDIGDFKFQHIPTNYFSFGYTSIKSDDDYFEIATREKAVCDLILLKRGFKIQSTKTMRMYLEDDMRIDVDSFKSFDLDIIEQCIENGLKKNELKLLRSVIYEYK